MNNYPPGVRKLPEDVSDTKLCNNCSAGIDYEDYEECMECGEQEVCISCNTCNNCQTLYVQCQECSEMVADGEICGCEEEDI